MFIRLLQKEIGFTAYSKTWIVLAAFFIPTFWLLALSTDPLVGDLTRIGGWTENDFGQNAPQPIIQVHANDLHSTAPDIAVLGDSFSVLNNQWQSALSDRIGLSIQTFAYADVGCVENWIEWAKNTPSKIVVIEIVERNFVGIFAHAFSCARFQPQPIHIAAGRSDSSRQHWPPTLDAKYLFHVALNKLRLATSTNEIVSGKRVINVPLKSGCAKFSNLRSDRLLYFSDDEKKKTQSAEEQVRALNQVVAYKKTLDTHGKQLIFVIVPDKSSVYEPCFSKSTAHNPVQYYAQTLRERGIVAPNLLDPFRQKIANTTDLYYPNNTHWSESGYLLMSEIMALTLRPMISPTPSISP